MGYFTTGQVANACKSVDRQTDEPRIRDLLRRGKIPEPAMRHGGRRLWTEQERDNAIAVVKKNRRVAR